MKITTEKSTKPGVPVFLSDKGEIMENKDGIKALRSLKGLKTEDLAKKCQASKRTVEGWEQGRTPRTEALYVMKEILNA